MSKKKEIILIINSGKLEDKRALAYTKSLDGYILNERDITSEPLTASQLAELATEMKIEAKGMIDQTSSYFQDELTHTDYAVKDLADIMRENPDVLRTPIIVANNQTFFVDSSFSMINKALTFEKK